MKYMSKEHELFIENTIHRCSAPFKTETFSLTGLIKI